MHSNGINFYLRVPCCDRGVHWTVSAQVDGHATSTRIKGSKPGGSSFSKEQDLEKCPKCRQDLPGCPHPGIQTADFLFTTFENTADYW